MIWIFVVYSIKQQEQNNEDVGRCCSPPFTMSNNARHTIIIKLSARAFTNPLSSSSQTPHSLRGGNPVTIFHFQRPTNNNDGSSSSSLIPSPTLRSYLAKTCTWESIITYSGYRNKNYQIPLKRGRRPTEDNNDSICQDNRVWFYMPSGEEVSFCAHAAMAACSVFNNEGEKHNQIRRKGMQEKEQTHNVNFMTGIIDYEKEESDDGHHLLQHNIASVMSSTSIESDDSQSYDEVTLEMKSSIDEQKVDRDVVLRLLDQVGVSVEDLHTNDAGDTNADASDTLPTFINSSVARYKTLVALK